MKFSTQPPEEARGDQFETASPVYDAEFEVGNKDYPSVHPLDSSVLQSHTDQGSGEATPPNDAAQRGVTVSALDVKLLHKVFLDPKTTTHQNLDKAAATTTSVSTVSSIPSTTLPDPVVPDISQPSPLGIYEVTEENNASTPKESSEDRNVPTPASILPGVMTDEAEIGGTEPPTFSPDIKKTSTPSQIDNFEGSASGEEEISGQDVYLPDIPSLTYSLPSIHPTLHNQPPLQSTDIKVTDGVVVAADGAPETGSGVEQMSGAGEASGDQSGLADRPPGVSATVLPGVATLTTGHQDTTEIQEKNSKPSRAGPFTHDFVTFSDHKKQPAVTTKPLPLISDQTSGPFTTSSAHSVRAKSIQSSAAVKSVDHTTLSTPRWAPIHDPSVITLPNEEFVDYDRISIPVFLESHPETPVKIGITEQVDPWSDLVPTVEPSPENIEGMRFEPVQPVEYM